MPEQSRATALVAQVTVPGQPAIATTLYQAPPVVNGGGAFAHPADGSILRIGAATTNATAQPGISSSAEASVRALAVAILGGEITAQTIDVRSAPPQARPARRVTSATRRSPASSCSARR